MALLQVLQFPDQRLRKKARPVTQVDAEVKQLAQDMLETMYHEKGIGLAATQVNRQQQLIVIDLSEERDQPLVLINPNITMTAGQQQMREGCLSVPDYVDLVSRAEHLRLKYTDLDNNTAEIEASGLLAVCIQHEIDHLDGKLFIDYLSPLKRERLQKKIKKQERIRHVQLL